MFEINGGIRKSPSAKLHYFVIPVLLLTCLLDMWFAVLVLIMYLSIWIYHLKTQICHFLSKLSINRPIIKSKLWILNLIIMNIEIRIRCFLQHVLCMPRTNTFGISGNDVSMFDRHRLHVTLTSIALSMAFRVDIRSRHTRLIISGIHRQIGLI